MFFFIYGNLIEMLLFLQSFPEVVGMPRGDAEGDRPLGGGRRRRTGGAGEELIIVTHLGSTETPFTHVNIQAPFSGKVALVFIQFRSRLLAAGYRERRRPCPRPAR